MNLPYAEHPGDEFLHPRDGWLLTLRAITYDNWLQWQHALPVNPQSRALLGQAETLWIEALARQLHRIHEACPGYKALRDSPFAVERWFDPHDPGTPWSEGRCCRFRVKDLHSRVFLERADRLRLPKQFKIEANDRGVLLARLEGDRPPAAPAAQSSRGSGRK